MCSKAICPVTKAEFPISINMPALPSSSASADIVVGCTLTLMKCPKCGEMHVWAGAVANDLPSTLEIGQMINTPGRQTVPGNLQHS
jgi:hypothetical protein